MSQHYFETESTITFLNERTLHAMWQTGYLLVWKIFPVRFPDEFIKANIT